MKSPPTIMANLAFFWSSFAIMGVIRNRTRFLGMETEERLPIVMPTDSSAATAEKTVEAMLA